MLSVLSPIIIAVIVGALVLRAFVRIPDGIAGVCLVFGFGLPLGGGLYTLVLFVGSTWWGLSGTGAYVAAALVAATAIGSSWWARRRGISQAELGDGSVQPARRILVAIAAVTAAAACTLCVSYYDTFPHGMWDAQAMWNARARVMFRAPQQWIDVLSQQHPHPDYPLMLSTLIFTGWSSLGRETQIVPFAIAMSFAAAGAAALTGSLALLKGTDVALLGFALLMSSAGYATNAASQYADIPLAAVFVGTAGLVVLAFASKTVHRTQLLILAGLFAATSGWIKNEVWILTVTLPIGIILAHPRNIRRAISDALTVVAGGLPVIGALIYFKTMTPWNDITAAAQGASTWDKLLDPNRFQHVALYYTQQFWPMQGTSVPLLGIVIGVLIIAGIKIETRLRGGLIAVAITWVLIVLGHIASFVVSPHDLQWHLATAASRLAMQMTPMLLFLMLCSMRTEAFHPTCRRIHDSNDPVAA